MHRGSGDHSSRKHDKHDKHSRSDRSKGKESAPSQSSSSRRAQEAPLTFLFMVNELICEETRRDYYHNILPGDHPRQYSYDIPSQVMRYNNGIVEAAPGYNWDRTERELWWDLAVQADGTRTIDPVTGRYWHPTPYSMATVFACNPHLPFLVVRADPTVTVTHALWEFLHLYNPRGCLEGITQVAMVESDLGRTLGLERGPGICKYAAGIRPSWIPGLLPETYSRPRNSPPSVGLGGELPIILGLMAFSEDTDVSQATNPITEMFLRNRRWRRNCWTDNSPPRGYPDPIRNELPRGFHTMVWEDPENPQGSNYYRLKQFEWTEAIVRG